MIGGWMIGTRAIYEYAATATAPRSFGDSLLVRKIDVGPSAPPMIPMEAASFRSNSIPIFARTRAPIRAKKMPNWAAAPSNADFGLASSGPKSVMAPTPMKISSGNTPVSIPTL